MRRRFLLLVAALVVITAFAGLAQFRRHPEARTARDIESDTGEEPPTWTNAPAFKKDVWTFTRIRYSSHYRRVSFRSGDWTTDVPDSDVNLSFRLQQMTSLLTDPNGRVIDLTDPHLYDYPWIYIVEPGRLTFNEEEVAALRKYLLNGGFLMVDDFWGEVQWNNFYWEIKRVFPDREPQELEMSHPIFHCVFPIRLSKNEMQVPNFRTGEDSQYNGGVTWENHGGEECTEVHFKAIFDDKQRIMVFIAHNTDNGDGWEREGMYRFYFREFAEKKAYPLGINAVFYAMTH